MTFVSRHQLLLVLFLFFFFFFFLSKSFYYNGEMICFSSKEKNCRFFIPRERKRREKTRHLRQNNKRSLQNRYNFNPSSGHPRWFGETLLFSLLPDAATDKQRAAGE
jgi:hypothetical protein